MTEQSQLIEGNARQSGRIIRLHARLQTILGVSTIRLEGRFDDGKDPLRYES